MAARRPRIAVDRAEQQRVVDRLLAAAVRTGCSQSASVSVRVDNVDEVVTPDRARGVPSAVIALCLVQFVDVLGVTVVVTALRSMLADLDAPESAGALIATGYAMFFGALLMLGARLGDRYGHRHIILIGLCLFAVAAVVGATAESIVVLTAARCLQGTAAAISVPSAHRGPATAPIWDDVTRTKPFSPLRGEARMVNWLWDRGARAAPFDR